MSHNKLITALAGLAISMSLVGCGTASVGELGLSIISPKGAPGLALARYQTKDSASITIGAPTSVVAAFTSNEKDVIIFDATKGTTFISKQGKKYKLAKVLTSGNAYVISTGKDSDSTINSGDKVVSFGSGSFFTSILKKAYGLTDVSEVADVSTAYTVAVNGVLENQDVSYVVLSEPYVSKALAANASLKVQADLAADWLTYSKAQGYNSSKGYSTFPMAGVFIKASVDEDASKKDAIEGLLKELSFASEDFKNNKGQEILKSIKADKDNSIYEPKEAYGLDYEALKEVFDPATNGVKKANPFGFIADEDFDFKAFSKEALNNDLADSVFSAYFKA